MCTGGEYRGVRHDRHFSSLELPDRGVPRPANGVERQAGARLATLAHHLQPAVAAVETLSDRWGRLRGATEAFHLFGPQQTLGGVSLTGGFPGALAGMLRADPRAVSLSRWHPSRLRLSWRPGYPSLTAAILALDRIDFVTGLHRLHNRRKSGAIACRTFVLEAFRCPGPTPSTIQSFGSAAVYFLDVASFSRTLSAFLGSDPCLKCRSELFVEHKQLVERH
jgi:hypothetical protein